MSEQEQQVAGVGGASSTRPSVIGAGGNEVKPAEIMLVDEVAEHLRIPKATLYQWRYNGTGPRSIKVGRHIRYRRSDVDAWLESNASDTNAA